MGQRFYALSRDLHLYAALFLSPFVLVFAASVFYLVHAPRPEPAATSSGRLVRDLPVSQEIGQLTGRAQVDALRPILDRLLVKGEVGYIRRIPRESRLVIPVSVPGRVTTVDLNLSTRAAAISEGRAGLGDALIYLHKMPGPHNANIRGNSRFLRVWRVLADATCYGLLFLALSGVYLWTARRAERRLGVALAILGAASFFGLIYAISH